jgi:hypothetical protein
MNIKLAMSLLSAIPAAYAGSFTSSTSGDASALPYGTFGVQAFAIATSGIDTSAQSAATAEQDTTVLADGPERPGYVLLSFSPLAEANGDGIEGASVDFAFGGYSYDAYAGQGSGLWDPYLLYPITLGVPIGVDVQASVLAVSEAGDGSSAIASGDVGFTFYEADQVTKVGWTDPVGAPASVPEPGTLALTVATFAVAAVFRL